MDGSVKNYMDAWAPEGGWVGLDLGSSVSATIAGIKYCPQPGGGSRLVGCKVQASNTPDFSSGVVDLFHRRHRAARRSAHHAEHQQRHAFRYVRFRAPRQQLLHAGRSPVPRQRHRDDPARCRAFGIGRLLAWQWAGLSDLEFRFRRETDYVIKRATSSGGPYTVLEYNSPWDTDYTDKGLSAGTYYYVVSAINSVGETVNSGEQSIQILLNVAPGSSTLASAGGGNSTEGSDKAIDGDVNTKWFTGGGTSSAWLQIDLGAGNAQIVIRYDITSAKRRAWPRSEELAAPGFQRWRQLDGHGHTHGETFASRFLTSNTPSPTPPPTAITS